MPDSNRFTIHCSNCGGQNIRADAYAEWNFERQEWELSNVFDARICDDCGHEVSVYEVVEESGRRAADPVLTPCAKRRPATQGVAGLGDVSSPGAAIASQLYRTTRIHALIPSR